MHSIGALLLAATLPLATPASVVEPGWFWHRPHCDTVYGDGGVTITDDDGAELAPTKERLWLQLATDRQIAGQPGGEGTRYIWQSDDGGRKFRTVLDQSRATLINGNRMWPSPVDPDLLYLGLAEER